MPRDQIEGEYFSADIVEFIKLLDLHKEDLRFLRQLKC